MRKVELLPNWDCEAGYGPGEDWWVVWDEDKYPATACLKKMVHMEMLHFDQ